MKLLIEEKTTKARNCVMANVWYPWETGGEREHFHTFVSANVIA